MFVISKTEMRVSQKFINIKFVYVSPISFPKIVAEVCGSIMCHYWFTL